MSVTENRTGIRPVETVNRYELSTSDVRDWMQKRVNGFIAVTRKKQMESTGKTTIPDVNVNIMTYEFSKKFAPFVVLLPEEAIDSREKASDDTMKFFLPEESERPTQIIQCIWGAFASFVYTKGEKKEFLHRDGQLKRHLQMSRNDCVIFGRFCSPRIMKSNNNKVVVFMIDPIKVFSEMVREANEKVVEKKGDKPKYQVNDITFDRINSENFMYHFNKVPRKRGKKGGNFDKKILNAMRNMIGS